jgi:hypothetical protein
MANNITASMYPIDIYPTMLMEEIKAINKRKYLLVIKSAKNPIGFIFIFILGNFIYNTNVKKRIPISYIS